MTSLFNYFDREQEVTSDDFDFRPHGSGWGMTDNDDALYNEINEEDIRRMAEALAPQMSELEDVLKGITATEDDVSSAFELAETTTMSMIDEDDDMDDELRMLATSEQSLREELEFAQDISTMLTPSKNELENQDENDTGHMSLPWIDRQEMLTPSKQPRARNDPPGAEKPPKVYTLQDHADYLKLRTEKIGGWYYCDVSQFVHTDMEMLSMDLVKDYCLPIPFRKLKRLYSGLNYHQVVSAKIRKELSTPARILASPIPSQADSSVPGTPIRTPVGSFLPSTPMTPATIPDPPPTLLQEEPLPVRTVAIRIRPDVLVGAVMESIHHAFEVLPNNSTSHVLKRQGGHLRAAVYMSDKALAYVADCQLCTQKNDELERRLILRFYHVQDDPEAMQELGQALHAKNSITSKSEPEPISANNEPEDNNIVNCHMKESCSLIQRLMAAQQQGGTNRIDAKQQSSWLGLKDTAFRTKEGMQHAVAVHLESNFKPSPSVREENKKATPTIRRLTLPSLSTKDWLLMEVSWGLTNSIFEELDSRDCSYNTILTLPFGQFPALQTLDVHYCSQLRRVSRESMINHLLKSAKDLEDYAKGAEYNCAICIALLEPMLVRYGIPPLDMPKIARSLEDYPMEYTLPQVACPPWGNLVSQALNHVQAKTPTNAIDAMSAVRMVYNAFVRQDDEEKSARLGRKNAQIMDRLATLQKHQRALVQDINEAHVYSDTAAREAAGFLTSAQQATNSGRAGFPRVLQAEVPLLSFRISQGASTSGTCYVTASQMLFVTSYIPILGASRSMLFDFQQIDFQVDESVPATLLNPFPSTMNIVIAGSDEVVFRFRPTISPARLLKFLKVIQNFANERQPSEFSSVVDNMNVVQDNDGTSHMFAVNSEDHISV